LSIRRRIAVLSAASIIALALALVALGGRAQNQALFAFAGTNDGFDIGVTDTNGNALTRVEPGTYTFVVRDRSTQHNFHFASNEDRTVDFRTELAFVGEQSFTVTLRPGTEYAYVCEPHWQTMNGHLATNAATTPPSAPPPPPPAPKPKTVRAGVTPGAPPMSPRARSGPAAIGSSSGTRRSGAISTSRDPASIAERESPSRAPLSGQRVSSARRTVTAATRSRSKDACASADR